MLGLLLLAGLGVAAAALVEHVDSVEEEDEAEPEEVAATGDLLDDPEPEPEPPPAEEAEVNFPEEELSEAERAAAEAPVAADPAAAEPGDAAMGADLPGPEADPAMAAEPAAPAPDIVSAQAVPLPVNKIYGTSGHDSLEGSAGRDFMEGRMGHDTLQGRQGNDTLVTFDRGQDRAWGGMGNDSLYGYRVNAMPGGDTSFVVEDQQTDWLHGGMGADKLWLASGDVGTGGMGQDEFHLSWDVDHANPARITDYQPSTDRIVIEFTSHSVQGDMDPISQADQNVTTAALGDGSGTAILLNGQPIAHVLGTTTLQASDIAVLHR